MQDKNPIDLLWDNIQIQYAAIIRSQMIMYVKDQEDLSSEVSMESNGEMGGTTAYEIQYAWDKQATYLQAQSRAMAELRNMIKQYDELCRSDMATEEQKARIDKLKVDIEKTKAETRTDGQATTITIVDEWADTDED